MSFAGTLKRITCRLTFGQLGDSAGAKPHAHVCLRPVPFMRAPDTHCRLRSLSLRSGIRGAGARELNRVSTPVVSDQAVCPSSGVMLTGSIFSQARMDDDEAATVAAAPPGRACGSA